VRDHLETIQCVVCRRWYAVRVQSEDWQRYRREGGFVQTALPCVPPHLRELWISGVGPCCWPLLCPNPITNPTAYN
jgi:hypothetical protein